MSQLLAPTWQGEKLALLQHLLLFFLPAGLLLQTTETLRTLCIQRGLFGLFYWPRSVCMGSFMIVFLALYPVFNYNAVVIAIFVSQAIEFGLYWRGLGLSWRPLLHSEGSRLMYQQWLPTTWVWLVFYITLLIDGFFLSSLPTGEPSAYRYAYVIMLNIANVSVMNFQIAEMGKLAQSCSQKAYSQVTRELHHVLIQAVAFSLPVIIAVSWAAPWLIRVVFERGAFTAHDTQLVAGCLQILIWQLPFVSLWRLVSNCYHSLYWVHHLLVIGVMMLAVRAGLTWWGLHWGGLTGACWMTTLSSYLLLASAAGYLFWRLRHTETGPSSVILNPTASASAP